MTDKRVPSRMSEGELAALNIAAICLDIEWEQWDTGASDRQGAYDARIHYRDGRIGAFEIVESVDETSRKLDSAIKRSGRQIDSPELDCAWFAALPASFILSPQASSGLKISAKWLAERNLNSLDAIWRTDERPPQISWLLSKGVKLWRVDADGIIPGRITLFNQGSMIGGFPNKDLPHLAEDVAQLLDAEVMRRHLRKLENATGVNERHLWIQIDTTGMEPRSLITLMDEEIVPSTPLAPVGYGLTHLWLCPAYPRSVYVWQTESSSWATFHAIRQLTCLGGYRPKNGV